MWKNGSPGGTSEAPTRAGPARRSPRDPVTSARRPAPLMPGRDQGPSTRYRASWFTALTGTQGERPRTGPRKKVTTSMEARSIR